MKKSIHTSFFCTTILAATLLTFSAGCSNYLHPHSAYRPVHEYATAGDIGRVTSELAAHSTVINLPDDAGLTPLHLAVLHCHTNVVALLIEDGADINRKGNGGVTSLHLAAQEGCIDGATMLLAKGAKVNPHDDKGWTPLKRAELWHKTAMIQFLREHGGTE